MALVELCKNLPGYHKDKHEKTFSILEREFEELGINFADEDISPFKKHLVKLKNAIDNKTISVDLVITFLSDFYSHLTKNMPLIKKADIRVIDDKNNNAKDIKLSKSVRNAMQLMLASDPISLNPMISLGFAGEEAGAVVSLLSCRPSDIAKQAVAGDAKDVKQEDRLQKLKKVVEEANVHVSTQFVYVRELPGRIVVGSKDNKGPNPEAEILPLDTAIDYDLVLRYIDFVDALDARMEKIAEKFEVLSKTPLALLASQVVQLVQDEKIEQILLGLHKCVEDKEYFSTVLLDAKSQIHSMFQKIDPTQLSGIMPNKLLLPHLLLLKTPADVLKVWPLPEAKGKERLQTVVKNLLEALPLKTPAYPKALVEQQAELVQKTFELVIKGSLTNHFTVPEVFEFIETQPLSERAKHLRTLMRVNRPAVDKLTSEGTPAARATYIVKKLRCLEPAVICDAAIAAQSAALVKDGKGNKNNKDNKEFGELGKEFLELPLNRRLDAITQKDVVKQADMLLAYSLFVEKKEPKAIAEVWKEVEYCSDYKLQNAVKELIATLANKFRGYPQSLIAQINEKEVILSICKLMLELPWHFEMGYISEFFEIYKKDINPGYLKLLADKRIKDNDASQLVWLETLDSEKEVDAALRVIKNAGITVEFNTILQMGSDKLKQATLVQAYAKENNQVIRLSSSPVDINDFQLKFSPLSSVPPVAVDKFEKERKQIMERFYSEQAIRLRAKTRFEAYRADNYDAKEELVVGVYKKQYEPKKRFFGAAVPQERATALTLVNSVVDDDKANLIEGFENLLNNDDFKTMAGEDAKPGWFNRVVGKSGDPLWDRIIQLREDLDNRMAFFKKFQDPEFMIAVMQDPACHSSLRADDLQEIFKTCQLATEPATQENRLLFLMLLQQHFPNFPSFSFGNFRFNKDSVKNLLTMSPDLSAVRALNDLRKQLQIAPVMPSDLQIPGISAESAKLSPEQAYQFEDTDMNVAEVFLLKKYKNILKSKLVMPVEEKDSRNLENKEHDVKQEQKPIMEFFHVPTFLRPIFVEKRKPARDEKLPDDELDVFARELRSLVDSYQPAADKIPLVFSGVLNYGRNHYISYFVHKMLDGKIKIMWVDPSPASRPWNTPEAKKACGKYAVQEKLRNMFAERVFAGRHCVFPQPYIDVTQQIRQRDCGPNALTVLEDAYKSATTAQPLLSFNHQGQLVLDPTRLSVNCNLLQFHDSRKGIFLYAKEATQLSQSNRAKWANRLSATKKSFVLGKKDDRGYLTVNMPLVVVAAEPYSYKHNVLHQRRNDENPMDRWMIAFMEAKLDSGRLFDSVKSVFSQQLELDDKQLRAFVPGFDEVRKKIPDLSDNPADSLTILRVLVEEEILKNPPRDVEREIVTRAGNLGAFITKYFDNYFSTKDLSAIAITHKNNPKAIIETIKAEFFARGNVVSYLARLAVKQKDAVEKAIHRKIENKLTEKLDKQLRDAISKIFAGPKLEEALAKIGERSQIPDDVLAEFLKDQEIKENIGYFSSDQKKYDLLKSDAKNAVEKCIAKKAEEVFEFLKPKLAAETLDKLLQSDEKYPQPQLENANIFALLPAKTPSAMAGDAKGDVKEAPAALPISSYAGVLWREHFIPDHLPRTALSCLVTIKVNLNIKKMVDDRVKAEMAKLIKAPLTILESDEKFTALTPTQLQEWMRLSNIELQAKASEYKLFDVIPNEMQAVSYFNDLAKKCVLDDFREFIKKTFEQKMDVVIPAIMKHAHLSIYKESTITTRAGVENVIKELMQHAVDDKSIGEMDRMMLKYMLPSVDEKAPVPQAVSVSPLTEFVHAYETTLKKELKKPFDEVKEVTDLCTNYATFIENYRDRCSSLGLKDSGADELYKIYAEITALKKGAADNFVKMPAEVRKEQLTACVKNLQNTLFKAVNIILSRYTVGDVRFDGLTMQIRAFLLRSFDIRDANGNKAYPMYLSAPAAVKVDEDIRANLKNRLRSAPKPLQVTDLRYPIHLKVVEGNSPASDLPSKDILTPVMLTQYVANWAHALYEEAEESKNPGYADWDKRDYSSPTLVLLRNKLNLLPPKIALDAPLPAAWCQEHIMPIVYGAAAQRETKVKRISCCFIKGLMKCENLFDRAKAQSQTAFSPVRLSDLEALITMYSGLEMKKLSSICKSQIEGLRAVGLRDADERKMSYVKKGLFGSVSDIQEIIDLVDMLKVKYTDGVGVVATSTALDSNDLKMMRVILEKQPDEAAFEGKAYDKQKTPKDRLLVMLHGLCDEMDRNMRHPVAAQGRRP